MDQTSATISPENQSESKIHSTISVNYAFDYQLDIRDEVIQNLTTIRSKTIEFCHTNMVVIGKYYGRMAEHFKLLDNYDGLEPKAADTDYWKNITKGLVMNLKESPDVNEKNNYGEEVGNPIQPAEQNEQIKLLVQKLNDIRNKVNIMANWPNI